MKQSTKNIISVIGCIGATVTVFQFIIPYFEYIHDEFSDQAKIKKLETELINKVNVVSLEIKEIKREVKANSESNQYNTDQFENRQIALLSPFLNSNITKLQALQYAKDWMDQYWTAQTSALYSACMSSNTIQIFRALKPFDVKNNEIGSYRNDMCSKYVTMHTLFEKLKKEELKSDYYSKS